MLKQCCITGRVEHLRVIEVGRDGTNPGIACVFFVVLGEIILPLLFMGLLTVDKRSNHVTGSQYLTYITDVAKFYFSFLESTPATQVILLSLLWWWPLSMDAAKKPLSTALDPGIGKFICLYFIMIRVVRYSKQKKKHNLHFK